MLAIANMNQDIETALKQDKSEGVGMAPLGPIVATPVLLGVAYVAYTSHKYDSANLLALWL